MLSRYLDAAGTAPGWLALAAAGVAVVAYCLGCFNGAVVVSRYILRNDVRSHGSGNAGLTNFYRVFGGPLTLVVILSDVVKAVLAVLFATFIAGHISPELVALAKYWAGTFCLLGHMYPCTFQFRGGKGILSGGAIAIMMGFDSGNPWSWCIPAVVWGGFILLAAATKYVLGRVLLPLRDLVCVPGAADSAAVRPGGRPDPVEAPGKYRPARQGHRVQILPPQKEAGA